MGDLTRKAEGLDWLKSSFEDQVVWRLFVVQRRRFAGVFAVLNTFRRRQIVIIKTSCSVGI
jgi:hypothetical protein